MGAYSKLINDLKLVKELKRSAGRDDIPEEEVSKLVAMVNETADVAGPLLKLIPVTFKQYTEHDIQHCRNLIDLMGRFIPRETLKRMNGLELSVLILSALLHDFGMFVTEEEKREALKSTEFDAFLLGHHDRATALEESGKKGDHERAEVLQDALLAEYFRRMHPERARTNILKNLSGKLVYRDVDISSYVADVCESHAWGVHESNDPKYPNNSVSNLSTNKSVYNVPLNLQYIACCLRLADIMDFDRSRTPVVVFQNIDFTEAKSWEEWNKHLSVMGWKIDERDVMFRTECKHPAFYVAVLEFLDWVDNELSECRRLVVKEAPKEIAERYRLNLPPVVDRSEVEMEDKSYLAGAFRFQLEYERIMRLLMDKSLYPDPSLFLRELLQNSLDACRNREAHAKEAGHENLYTPRIAVWDYSDDVEDPRIIFQDNGVGMSRKIVENYFMRVGRSYYRSPEFDAERARLKKKDIELEATSQFGIGILSCFMVADRFEVETYKVGGNPLHITIEGPTKYFTIKLLPEPPREDFTPKPDTDAQDGPPSRPGTRITIHLRDDAKVKVFETLNTFAVNVEYNIHVHQSTDPHQQTIPRRQWERKPYWLNQVKIDNWLRRSQEEEAIIIRSVSNVLTPSVITLTGNSLSPHLRGSAWLWLLQDKGGVCPRRGYLKMTARGITPIGLPVYISEARSSIWLRSFKFGDVIPALQTMLSGKFEMPLGQDEYISLLEIMGEEEDDDFIVRRFISGWNKLSPEERKVFHNSIGIQYEEDEPWYGAAGTVKELLEGTYRWACEPLEFDSKSVDLAKHPCDVALHGVRLPAGFVTWNPLEGTSDKSELLPVPGGAHLDVRGPTAPIPAANRLFIDKPEAEKVLIPLTRLVLRHALTLAAKNTRGLGWDEWIADLIESIRYIWGYEAAIMAEWELLQRCLKYKLKIGEGYIYLSRKEVMREFGRWAPVSGDSYLYKGRNGLILDGSTSLLITSKVLGQRTDGFWEVDMKSNLPIHRETLHDFHDKALRKVGLIT